MLHKALGQVVNMPGNLQGGGFHVLGAIFNLFYASLLQSIQAALRWKRIKGSNVPACYQQAAGLALMVFEEVERQLYTAFTIYLDGNETLKDEWQQQESFTDRAWFFARTFESWCDDRLANSTDQVFRLMLHYAKWMQRHPDRDALPQVSAFVPLYR
jgi:hypothetical protein